MNIMELKEELASIETLILDGIITPQRGEAWKEKILKQYEGEKFPNAQPTSQNRLPNDVAHIPGRMVAGIFSAIKMINADRCAGQAPEQKQQRSSDYNTRETRRGPPTVDDLPEMYK